MKYIDSEKLIAKMQPYYENAKCKARYAAETGTSSDCTKWNKANEIYEHILRIIKSLQQEQPEDISLIKHWFEHIAQIADDRKTLTGEVMEDSYALDEIKSIAKNSIYYIEHHTNTKEVHYKLLDKDLEHDAVSFCFDNGLNTTPHIAKTIAKHYYELGFENARKEEQEL